MLYFPRKVKELHIETIELEKQNQEMEQKLNQLRQSMSREKEERERSNGYYWKSGQVGHFGSQNKENIGKISSGRIKLKVLKDQIEETEKRKVVATSTKIPSAERTKIKGKTCGQCEMKTALLMCVECGEDYCPSCFAKIHQKGALKLHRTMPVKWKSPTDKLDASYQPKKEQNFDESREKLGADKEISSNMVSTATFSSIQKQKINEQADFFVPTKPLVNNDQSLLHGTFDEEESSKSFKDAVLEWRNGYHGYQSKQSESETDCTGNSETQTVLTGATNSFEVEFKDNGLKYMERLMLKKHRRTPIDYVTKTDNYRSSRTSVPEFNDTQALTADEMEDHEYFVELFKPKEDVRTEVIHEPALKIMELVEPPEDHLEESRSFLVSEEETDVCTQQYFIPNPPDRMLQPLINSNFTQKISWEIWTNIVSKQSTATSKIFEKESKKKMMLELHAIILSEYHKVQRIPRGLRMSTCPTLFSDRKEYTDKFESILNKCSFDLITWTVEFAQREIDIYKAQINQQKEQMVKNLLLDEYKKVVMEVEKSVSDYRKHLESRKRTKFIRDEQDYSHGTVYRWHQSTGFARRGNYAARDRGGCNKQMPIQEDANSSLESSDVFLTEDSDADSIAAAGNTRGGTSGRPMTSERQRTRRARGAQWGQYRFPDTDVCSFIKKSDTSPVRTTAKRKNIPQHSTFSVTRENAALAEDVTAINVEKEEDQLLTTSRLTDSKSMKYNGSNDNHSLDTAGVVNLSKELQSIALRGESAAVQYYGLKGFFVLDVDPKETIHDRTPLQTIKQTATEEIFCRDGSRWRPESSLSECADKSVVDNIVTNIQIQYPKHLVEHMSSPMQANQRMQKPLTVFSFVVEYGHILVSQSPRSYSSKTRSQKRSELCQISHTRNVITRPVSRAASEISEIESIDLTEQDDPLFEDHEERKTLSILEKELHALRDDLDKKKKQPQELVPSVRSSKKCTEFSQKKQVKEHTNTDWLPKRAMESLQSCDVETESDDDKESLQDKLNVLSLQ
ncbi:zinc finger B-box domain-containing protein 1 [Bombina bombina]|uniref:zinc finger B-box domain-containing protein 1 n=1 Tax=Bombina bombina TaxID=8345 RepID=UPI00235B003D|nr:zinc finger B-box domain-containing protein 1 [Bombina bombina]